MLKDGVNNNKEKNPKAIFVKSSDKDALKQALKGNVENVVNYYDDLDLRKLKGDNVVEGKAPVKKEKTPVENKTPKKRWKIHTNLQFCTITREV